MDTICNPSKALVVECIVAAVIHCADSMHEGSMLMSLSPGGTILMFCPEWSRTMIVEGFTVAAPPEFFAALEAQQIDKAQTLGDTMQLPA